MTIHSPTLLVIALVVLAASLASYGLSQWLARRGNERLGIGLALGAALLLTAIVMVVLAGRSIFRIELALFDNAAEQAIEPASPGVRTTVHAENGVEKTAVGVAHVRTDATLRTANPANDHARLATNQSAAAATGAIASASSSAPDPRTATGPSVPYEPIANTEPWAATRCVFAIQPDPADLHLWRLENECGAAVGILVASCEGSRLQCSDERSTSWKYPERAMLLPAKATRSVTYAEQAQRGRHLRYAACQIGVVHALELANIEMQSRAAHWLSQFDTATQDDGCLSRVGNATAAGRRAGLSIDALLGRGIPGRLLSSR